MTRFSDTFSYLRKRDGLNQQELADKIHLSRSIVAMYESGQRLPSYEALEAIADVFNVSIDFLVGRIDSGEYSSIFRDNLSVIIAQADSADLEACGIDLFEIDLILRGAIPLTFDRACELCDEIGVSLNSMLETGESVTPVDDGLAEMTKVFTSLSQENRSKLLELSRLYLNAQSSNEETK